MMDFDPISRLREIAAERQRLAEEEAHLLDMLAGAAPSAPCVSLLVKDLRPLKQAAGEFGVSEKRMRRWAANAGARRLIAGRVLVDIAILKGQVWPGLAG
jgi:hypothetical protein